MVVSSVFKDEKLVKTKLSSFSSFVGSLCDSMLKNQFDPDVLCASVNRIALDKVNKVIWPITVGCKVSLEDITGLELSICSRRGILKVPITCPQHRFTKPSGLGGTLIANSVVLKFPDVAQYLVTQEMREPNLNEAGCLCCCSSSTSASLKGIIRYCAAGTVCRVFSSGTNQSLRQLREILEGSCCRSYRLL